MVVKKAKTTNKCIEEIRHPKVKVHDPGTGMSAVLLNNKKANIRRIRMDGCLATTGQRAADFVVSLPKIVDVIVELKGGDVGHAVTQVEATRIFWRSHIEYDKGQTIGAWIVCTEYPRGSLKVGRYRENFRAGGGILLISTHNGEERSFSEFVPKHP
ncbi:MAG: hypothetical protein WBQ94_08620 [Terracidiphilus sp.]